MPQDAFTLQYLCKELNSIFKGGKVNRITQPSNDQLILTIYTGTRTEKLLLDVNPSAPRIGIVNEEKESPLIAPNFCMLMRKHLLSSTIESVELVGFDRIIKIDVLSSGEFFDSVKKSLYIELMGRYSNIILTEKGKVLGGNRGINMFDDVVRPLIVGKTYVYPPVGQKKPPFDKDLINLFNNIDVSELPKFIVENVQGIALSTANEIAYFFKEKSDAELVNGKDFFNHLNDYLFNTTPNPCILEKNEEMIDVLVYPYHLLEGKKIFFNKLYQAEDVYFVNKEEVKQFKYKKERLTSITNTALKKAKKRLLAIKAKEKDASSAEENRIKGELILSNLYKIKQGQKQCILQNYYNQTDITIELNEFLSPSKNAENYYKKYNKQKRALIMLKEQRDLAEKEQNYLISVLDEIYMCDDITDLIFVEKELLNTGLIKEQKQIKNKKQEQENYRNYLIDGFRVKVGKNNIQNDKLTFSAKSNDMWLHAKDYHSSHLIIQCENREIPISVIKTSAEICAYYSKGREGGKVEIVYAKKKDVKKPSHAKLGFVVYENFKSIMVEADKHIEILDDK